jgi:hypothetical protein
MKPQQGTRVPLVVAGIVDAVLADDPDPDHVNAPADGNAEYEGMVVDGRKVEVVDGPPVNGQATEDDVLAVAPGDPGEPGVIVDRIPQNGLGRVAYLERSEVTMLISCVAGDTDMTARRARAAAIFDAVKRRVDADQVHAGLWDRLYLGPQEVWHHDQSPDGAIVWVGFTVIAEAVL